MELLISRAIWPLRVGKVQARKPLSSSQEQQKKRRVHAHTAPLDFRGRLLRAAENAVEVGAVFNDQLHVDLAGAEVAFLEGKVYGAAAVADEVGVCFFVHQLRSTHGT